MRNLPYVRMSCYLLASIATFSTLAAPGDVPLTTIMRWSGNGNSPDNRTSTFIPWLTPVALLKLPYSSWTPAERQKVPLTYYENFWTMVQERIASGKTGCSVKTTSFYLERTLSRTTEPTDAVAVAKNFPLIVVGTIVNEHPAWDFQLQRMASIAYVRVDEVVKNGQNRSLPSYVTFNRNYGSTEVQGTTLCSSGDLRENSEAGTARQLSGTPQIVLVGTLASGNSDYVHTARELIFRIDNGDLLYPPGVEAYPLVSMDLIDFKNRVIR